MNPFQPRPARPEDQRCIRQLVLSARLNPSSLKWSRFTVAVTKEDSLVIGCGQIRIHRDGSQELASLVVEPDWRGRGVGHTLVEHLTATARGSLFLMCRASLGEFYEQFGFQRLPFAQMPPYFQRVSRLAHILDTLRKEGETLLIMRRA